MNPLVNAAVQVLTISFEGFRVIDQEYGPVLLLFTSLSLCLIGFFVISKLVKTFTWVACRSTRGRLRSACRLV
jgi:hypothetical protein